MNEHSGNELRIGWAARDVTPNRPVNLQGQFHMRISQGVKDPLTVTALALADASGTDAAVFLSVDNAFITDRVMHGIRDAVRSQAPDLDTSKIIANSTHTHTAPMLEDGMYPPVPPGVMTGKEYADFFIERAAQALVEAWRGCGKATVAWGLGQAVVGRNRRAVYFDDLSKRSGHKDRPGHCTTRFARMYGNSNDPMFSHIEGYEDHSVDLLYTWNARDELSGVIVNLACPSQETEELSVVSADCWHEIRCEIRRRLGPNVFVLPQCAAAGDQSPHLLYYKAAQKRMLDLQGIDMRVEIGRRVAQAVEETLAIACKDRRDSMPLRHIVKEIQLPRRLITAQEAELIRSDIAALERQAPSLNPDPAKQLQDAARIVALKRCRLGLERYERQAQDPSVPVEVHAIRLGEVAVVTNPFELFLDYGIRIKARSPSIQTFIVQLAMSGAGWDGCYLPTVRAEQGESYSANMYCNSVGSAGGQALVEETLAMLADLWQDA